MAAIGGLLGLVVARRIAAPHTHSDQTADNGSGPAADSDGSGALWSELRSRRRSLLTDRDGSAASDRSELHRVAPPTERDPQILDLASVDAEPLDPAPAGEQAPGDSHDGPQAEAEAAPSPLVGDPLPEDQLPVPTAATSAERIAGADPAELSQVELLERLALSLQRRSHAALRVRDGAGSDAPLLEAIAAPVPDDDDDEDPGEPAAEPGSGYPSLLDLGRPAASPLDEVEASARQDDFANEPAVVFPGQAERRSKLRAALPVAAGLGEVSALPARRPFDAPGSAAVTPQDAEETEKALRAALAALQRMSGAA